MESRAYGRPKLTLDSTDPKNTEQEDHHRTNLMDDEIEVIAGSPTPKPRLSFRAKLVLATLGTVLPLLLLTLWLFRGYSNLWLVWVGGLLSLVLGLILVHWAAGPISSLSLRAKSLAGMKIGHRRFFGLISTEPPWDQAMSTALDEIMRSLSEIQALSRISLLITSDQGLESILGGIVEEAVKLLSADAGIIGLWDAEKQVFQDVVACNLPIAFPGREFGGTDSFTSQVAKTGRVIFLDDYENYPYRIKELECYQFHATLGTPLMVKGESKGAITVLSTDPACRFTYRDGQLLSTFANQAGAALEKIRLYQIAVDQLEALTLTKEQLAAERQELERAFANMVQVQENERARIAADIHDGVVQSMIGGLYEIQAAMVQFPEAPEKVKAKQEKARNLLKESIFELRRVIYDLRPLTLDRAGLAPAVEQLAEEFEQIANLRPRVHISGTPYRFSSQAETAAYRVVQESLNNAYKHARATNVEVVLRFSTDLIEITIADNGKGFQLEDIASEDGKRAGLIGMKDRARSVGGNLNITSAAGEGTEIAVVIPRTPPERDRTNDEADEEVLTPSSTQSVL